MNNETLQKAIAISTEIANVERGIYNIDSWIKKIKQEQKRFNDNDINGDCCYNLVLSEYNDGTGERVILRRNHGNSDIILGVKKILETQLEELNKQLKQL